MPTTDFSRVSDEVLEDVFNRLFDNPGLIPNEVERRAWVAERNRRAAGGMRAPDNVDANLEAAASPVEVDPTPSAAKPKTWRDMSDDELVAPVTDAAGVTNGDLEAYGERYRQAVSNTIDRGVERRMAARAAGIQDPSQAAYNAATGLDAASAPMTNPDAVMVDGVRVPTHRLSDGQSFGGMYTLRALREAKDAAEEQRLAAMFDQSAKEDIAKYGTRAFFRYKRDENGELIPKPGGGFEVEDIPTEELVGPDGRPDPTLAAQQENVRERRDMWNRQASQNRALRNRPGANMLRARQEASRDFLRMRNMLAGGSNNINAGNVGMFNQLAMMTPEDQIRQLQYALPGGQLLAQVEARQLDQAARLAGDAITGALAGQGQNDRVIEMRQAQRMENFRALAGEAAMNAWSGYERRDAERALIRSGASAGERAQILADIFGAAADAGPPPVPEPLPLPEGHGNPGRMPDGTYPMM